MQPVLLQLQKSEKLHALCTNNQSLVEYISDTVTYSYILVMDRYNEFTENEVHNFKPSLFFLFAFEILN